MPGESTSSVCAELVALAVVELFDRADEADVAFLNEVQEGHSPADVLLGDADDEAQVCLGEMALGAPSGRLCAVKVPGEGELVGLDLLVVAGRVSESAELGDVRRDLEDVVNLFRKEPAVEGEFPDFLLMSSGSRLRISAMKLSISSGSSPLRQSVNSSSANIW